MMEGKELKRGCQTMIPESEEESSAKQPKLSGPQVAMGVEQMAILTLAMEDDSNVHITDCTAGTITTADTSETVKVETDKDFEDFEDLTEECSKPGEGSEMMNLEKEEESSKIQPEPEPPGEGSETMNLEKEEGSSKIQPEPEPSGEVFEMMNLEKEEKSSKIHPKPTGEGFEMMNLEKEEESSKIHPKPTGEDGELVPDDPPLSDSWKYVTWQKHPSSLWVVTKCQYSCDWIKDVLKSDIFNQYNSDEKAKKFEIDGNGKFRKSVSSCSCVLFCFNSDQWGSESSQEVEELSSFYGLKKVVILVSEKSPDNWPPGQMNVHHNFPVLNFSKHQIAWYEDNLKLYNTKIEKIQQIVKGSASWKRLKVGIFSRSSESEYEWLKMKLESEYFRGVVEKVQSCYISNRGFAQFMTNVSECTFGILYHTKNRGRINITDVTDSLYDEELDYMSQMMNKHVIVVVDDLNNSSDEEKSRILRSQPSIKEKASDLFLFTTEEKKLLKPLMEMRNSLNGETKETINENNSSK